MQDDVVIQCKYRIDALLRYANTSHLSGRFNTNAGISWQIIVYLDKTSPLIKEMDINKLQW